MSELVDACEKYITSITDIDPENIVTGAVKGDHCSFELYALPYFGSRKNLGTKVSERISKRVNAALFLVDFMAYGAMRWTWKLGGGRSIVLTDVGFDGTVQLELINKENGK